jgi:two-component system LytT family sensor kinase
MERIALSGHMKRRLRFTAAVLGISSLMALTMVAQANLRAVQNKEEFEWFWTTVSMLMFWYIWAIIFPFVVALVRRFPLGAETRFSAVAMHVVAALAICFVHMVMYVFLFRVFIDGSDAGRPFWSAVLDVQIPLRLIIYAALVGAASAMEYLKKFRERDVHASQLETRLVEAQLHALKMQLHPHFLFNTLNGIMVLIQENPAVATRTVARLSEFLRLTLENAGVQEVTLLEEMEFLRKYLQIEQMRFGDRLTVREDIDPGVLDALVPNMILQPLVENSIRHGVAKKRGPALIEILAHRNVGILVICVRDNGRGLPEEDPNGAVVKEGIGLGNTRARLQQLYGDKQSLKLIPVEGGGLEICLSVPLRERIVDLPEILEEV